MDQFLSCDWGTSSFRLRLIRYADLQVLAEEKNDTGIAKIFRAWQGAGANEAERQLFYYTVIADAIDKISKQLNANLSGLPVIVSGMLSATIGMVDLPYKQTPVATDGSNLEVKKIKINGSGNELIIISGIRTDDDVIRGEETKAVGCASYLIDAAENLIVFPGTHPKHVTIKNGEITGIKTYMTGEFFDLLVTHSVLAASVKKSGEFNKDDFKNGVKESLTGSLLHSAFGVRTNDLLKKMPKENNFHYLSGLLIGTELKELINCQCPIYLCGGADLMTYYKLACDELGLTIALQIDADEALLKGQKQLVNHIF